MLVMKTPDECPCGSGKPHPQCCEPYINGAATAPTAEALMRSRYTAYVMGNERYLLNTWHSSTRPERIEMNLAMQWIRLKILNSKLDQVEFVATYKVHGKAHLLHERSQFVYENQHWFYVNGVVTSS